MPSNAARTTRRRIATAARLAIAALAIVTALLGAPARPAFAQAPQTPAARDGFLPVDEGKLQEQLPAAPLVMAAYAVAWLVILGYLWSLWSRLARVERDIAAVSRRIEAGARR